jgi:hypothetical protein
MVLCCPERRCDAIELHRYYADHQQAWLHNAKEAVVSDSFGCSVWDSIQLCLQVRQYMQLLLNSSTQKQHYFVAKVA